MTLSPVKASTIDVTKIDSLTTVTSTKKKASPKALQSPLAFTAVSPLSVGATSPFLLGSLKVTPFKNKVATLNLAINGVAGGTPFVLNLIYTFTVGVTSGCNLPGKQCAKAISITPGANSPITVKSGNSLYTIAADGFVEVLGEPVRNYIRPASPKTGRTDLFLQGSVSVTQLPPSPVPLPAAGLMLLGALGAIGMVRRRAA